MARFTYRLLDWSIDQSIDQSIDYSLYAQFSIGLSTNLDDGDCPSTLQLDGWIEGPERVDSPNHGQRRRVEVRSEHHLVQIGSALVDVKRPFRREERPLDVVTGRVDDGVNIIDDGAVLELYRRLGQTPDVGADLDTAGGERHRQLVVDGGSLFGWRSGGLDAVGGVVEADVQLAQQTAIIERRRKDAPDDVLFTAVDEKIDRKAVVE